MARRTMAISVLILLVLVILPVVAQSMTPAELYTYLSKAAGIDLRSVLSQIAASGVVMVALVLLGSFAEKGTSVGLAASITSKVGWLALTVYGLSLGDLHHPGLSSLGSEAGGASNIVTFDLRPFLVLSAAITALKITYSVLENREAKIVV